jgi:hypothetical protein
MVAPPWTGFKTRFCPFGHVVTDFGHGGLIGTLGTQM